MVVARTLHSLGLHCRLERRSSREQYIELLLLLNRECTALQLLQRTLCLIIPDGNALVYLVERALPLPILSPKTVLLEYLPAPAAIVTTYHTTIPRLNLHLEDREHPRSLPLGLDLHHLIISTVYDMQVQ
jgi:hypothetical protein